MSLPLPACYPGRPARFAAACRARRSRSAPAAPNSPEVHQHDRRIFVLIEPPARVDRQRVVIAIRADQVLRGPFGSPWSEECLGIDVRRAVIGGVRQSHEHGPRARQNEALIRPICADSSEQSSWCPPPADPVRSGPVPRSPCSWRSRRSGRPGSGKETQAGLRT